MNHQKWWFFVALTHKSLRNKTQTRNPGVIGSYPLLATIIQMASPLNVPIGDTQLPLRASPWMTVKMVFCFYTS